MLNDENKYWIADGEIEEIEDYALGSFMNSNAATKTKAGKEAIDILEKLKEIVREGNNELNQLRGSLRRLESKSLCNWSYSSRERSQ